MNSGDLILIRVWPCDELRFGLLVQQLGWREVMELQIRCRRAWWVHFPDINKMMAYDEDLIILLSEDENEHV
tara:strand:+ start:2566 stop:2781 length:216 start_codon:yes stop_codon:yes gene_type:complete